MCVSKYKSCIIMLCGLFFLLAACLRPSESSAPVLYPIAGAPSYVNYRNGKVIAPPDDTVLPGKAVTLIYCGSIRMGDKWLALLEDGTVWQWYHYEEEVLDLKEMLEDVELEENDTPRQVDGLSGIIQIAGSPTWCFALSDQGEVWHWGQDLSQFASDDPHKAVILDRPEKLASLPFIKQIYCWGIGFYTLDQEGHIWIWGMDHYRMLGDPARLKPERYAVSIASGNYYHPLYELQRVPHLDGIEYLRFSTGSVLAYGEEGSCLWQIKQPNLTNSGHLIPKEGESPYLPLMNKISQYAGSPEGYYLTAEDVPNIDDYEWRPYEAFAFEENVPWIDFWSDGYTYQLALNSEGLIYCGLIAENSVEMLPFDGALPAIKRITAEGYLQSITGETYEIGFDKVFYVK